MKNNVSVKIDSEILQTLKHLSIDQEITLFKLHNNILRDYLKQQGKPVPIKNMEKIKGA